MATVMIVVFDLPAMPMISRAMLIIAGAVLARSVIRMAVMLTLMALTYMNVAVRGIDMKSLSGSGRRNHKIRHR